jgi:hypothetical protein
MAITVSIVISLGLVAATVLIHYELLRYASGLTQELPKASRRAILAVILTLFFAHIVEAGLYAVAFALMHTHPELGAVAGEVEGGWLDFVYFSLATYTTLGIGDLHPRGALRLIAAVESLNGLVLIGWSASFTYLSMERLWDGTSNSR